MHKIKGSRSRIQNIEIGKISVHPIIQRRFDQHRAEQLVKQWDANALRELMVVPDTNRTGNFFVFEGQHRLWAAGKLYQGTWAIPCRVFEDLSIEQLADIQLKITRGTKAWRVFDSFRLKLTKGEVGATEIKSILDGHDLVLSEGRTLGSVSAVAALEAIFSRGGKELLDRVLSLLQTAWGKDPDAYNGTILRGAGLFVSKFNGSVDDAALAERLKKTTSAGALLGSARSYSKSTRLSPHASVAQLFVKTYNSKRRANHQIENFH